MNKRLKKYYQWRIYTLLKRFLRIVEKEIYIITPSYAYDRRKDLFSRCVQSIIQQQTHPFQVHHLIVFDGEQPETIEMPALPSWYHYRILSTPRTACYGAHQRNVGAQIIEKEKKGWAIFLDDDNELKPNALNTISKYLDARVGVYVFRVWHEELKAFVPKDLSKVPKYLDIDTLCLVVNANVIGLAQWQSIYHHDFLYAQNIISMAQHYGYSIQINADTIGVHH
ncbi:MAG: glycosyltransferase family 2 protein [bacterium]|nr:glycosyltransferase family 2 protein [bacterium]